MVNTDAVISTLLQYLIQIPIYLVWLVGIWLALRYRRAYPRPSTFALIGFAIFFVRSLIGTALNMWLPMLLSQNGWGGQRIGLLLTARNIVDVLIAAVAWALIVAAMFYGRQMADRRA